MKSLVKCSVVLVVFLLLGGAAIAQQNDFGGEGKTSTAQQTTRRIRLLNALPDGDQPLIIERKSGTLPKGAVSDELLEQVPQGPVVYTLLWEGLDQLSLSDKQNALIQLEVPHNLQTPLLNQVQEIEPLWNSGQFDLAIARLRDLEESQGLRGIAVGISWKVPVTTSEPKWGTDVQIGARSDIRKSCLDFHDGTGNLFAALRYYELPYWCFSVYISMDGGQTWSETYTRFVLSPIDDISAAVVSSYLYLGYTADVSGVQTSARMRRFSVTDGSLDATYYQEVFDNGVAIDEIAVMTNADQVDNRVYYFAILADGSLVYYWADQQGESWQQIATGIGNADRGLDACWNQDWTQWYLWVSFVATDDQLHVARKSAGGWEDRVLYSNARNITSVGAYQDRILVAYEILDLGIGYQVSYDEGDSWLEGMVAYHSYAPHVTGRKGGGFAVVYNQEVGEPDLCWFWQRDYGTGPGTAYWSDPELFNEVDVFTGTPMTVEWIPPLDPACHAYGSIWISGDPHNAYFDRIDRLPGDPNGDEIVDLGDVILVLNYLFKEAPAPIPLWTADANCDELVDLGDAIRLLNYLFKEGDPPCC